MSAVATVSVPCPAPSPSPDDAEAAACRWIESHHDQLVRLTHYAFCRRRPQVREEAVAECLAQSYRAAIGAARRGTLHRLTPATCVRYAARHFRSGRRFAGSSTRCAMAEGTRTRHGCRTISLDQAIDDGEHRQVTLADCLADNDAESPLETVRREHDYPHILDCEQVSTKAKATFAFLAEHRGEGRLSDLAARLMVSPGRISQLKRELGAALARHDYHGPLGRRPVA